MCEVDISDEEKEKGVMMVGVPLGPPLGQFYQP